MPVKFPTPMFLVTTQRGEFVSCVCHHFSFTLCQDDGWVSRLRQGILGSEKLGRKAW